MTLTELSFYTRKAMPFAISGVLFILIIFYIFKLFFVYVDQNRPAVVATDIKFGKIEKPFLQAAQSAGYTFTLDTIEGKPVTATSSAQIFLLPPASTQFGYREKINLMAQTVGFDPTTTYQLQDKEATFTDDKQTFTIDISTFNFSYEYDLKKDELLLLNTRIPAEAEIEGTAINFLTSLDKYPQELSQGKMNVIYLKYSQEFDKLAVVQNPQEANMVEVDFYRPDIDTFPVVSPTYFNSQNHVVMLFHDEDFKIVKAAASYWPKSEGEMGIYPIKTGQEAWDQLNAGHGFVINPSQSSQNVTIKRMFLAYLDPVEYQPYLQPVYVFLGTDDFVGYIPAVTDQYLQ